MLKVQPNDDLKKEHQLDLGFGEPVDWPRELDFTDFHYPIVSPNAEGWPKIRSAGPIPV